MPLSFYNAFPSTVCLAVLLQDSGCGPTNHWRKAGWYRIASGTVFHFTDVDLRGQNEVMAWYADQYANNAGAT